MIADLLAEKEYLHEVLKVTQVTVTVTTPFTHNPKRPRLMCVPWPGPAWPGLYACVCVFV